MLGKKHGSVMGYMLTGYALMKCLLVTQTEDLRSSLMYSRIAMPVQQVYP